jgi:hypothetical protein
MIRKVERTKDIKGRGAPALFVIFICFIMLCSTFPGPMGHAEAKGPGGRQDSGVWTATKAWADSERLWTAKIGDVWPGHPGNEIVVGGDSNWTTMIYGHEDSWQAVRLFQEAWYVTNIAIGHVDPDIPGNQIVNVGWHGNVSMIYWDNATQKWKHVELVNGLKAHLAWGYGVAIGPFDPRHPGNQVAITDDNGQLVLVRKNGTGWAYEVIWKDGGPGITNPYLETVLLSEVDSTHPGNEIVVTGGSRWVTELYYNTTDQTWTVKRLWRDRKAPVAIAVGDLDSRYQGNQIAVVGFSKNLTVLHWNGTGWAPEQVYHDSDAIYDARVGEIQPGMGPEVVMGGWSSNVTAHRSFSVTAWDSRIIYKDPAYVLGLAIGDCDDLHPGNEIIVVDNSGVVTKLQYETPDFVLYSPAPENGAVPGAYANFDIMVYSRAGFHDMVALYVRNLPVDWDFVLLPTTLSPTGRSLLKVYVSPAAIEGRYKVTVNGLSGDMYHTVDVWVTVLAPDEKDFGFSVLPGAQSVVADYSVKFTIATYQINAFSDPVALSVVGLPDGASAVFTPQTVTPPGSAIMEVRTVSSTPKGLHYLTVLGTGGGKQHSATVALTVEDASSPDFSIGAAPTTISMVGSHSANISVNLVSIYGFSGNVSLSVPELMDGVKVKFTPPGLVPSGTSIMNLTIDASVPADTYYFEVQGTSGETTHSAIIRVDLNVAGNPDFSLKADPAQANVTASFSAFFNVTIIPHNDFAGKVDLSVQGLPTGATAIFSPPIIGPGQISQLEVKTLVTMPGSQNTLVVWGKGSGLERNTLIRLKMIPAKALLRIVRVDGIPSSANNGQVIKVHVFVENKGLVDARVCKMSMFVDGIIQDVKSFQVSVNNTTEIDTTWTAVSGKHNITIEIVSATPTDIVDGKYSRTVNVTNPLTIVTDLLIGLVIAIMVIVLLALAGGFLLGKRGQRTAEEDEVDELDEMRPRKKKKVRRPPED